MNTSNNRIKINGNCCVHCGKIYKKRENLDKHILFCDLLNNSKKMILNNDNEYELVIPSSKNMYIMLLELGKKYIHLEDRMNEMKKCINIKKKKMNILEWLNTNMKPKILFDSIVSCIHVIEKDAVSILDNSFYDVFHEILSRELLCLEDKPIYSLNQKTNIFYIYQILEDGNKGWIVASREKLVWLFNKIHMKLVDVFYSWKKVKNLDVELNKDKFEMACDKATIKLMNVDFSVENIFSKTKYILFSVLKKYIKAFVEYDFDT
jgi:hypothetical protein